MSTLELMPLLGSVLTSSAASGLVQQMANSKKPFARMFQGSSFEAQFKQVSAAALEAFLARHPQDVALSQDWLREVLAQPDLMLWFWLQYEKGQPTSQEVYVDRVVRHFKEAAPALEVDTASWSGDLYECYRVQFRTVLPAAAQMMGIDEIGKDTKEILEQNKKTQASLERIEGAVLARAQEGIRDDMHGEPSRRSKETDNVSARPFWGRLEEQQAVLRAVDKKLPIQILGLRNMGKTAFLNHLANTLSWPYQFDRVLFATHGLVQKSPAELVRQIALQLGEQDWADRLLQPQPHLAKQALDAMVKRRTGLVLLIDDAAWFASGETQFDEDFFVFCRSLTQARRLVWVSTSVEPLQDVFSRKGLTSLFLTESKVIWLGGLVYEEVLQPSGFEADFLKRLDGLSGGRPHAFFHLADLNEAQRQGQCLEDELADCLESDFKSWWLRLDRKSRQCLLDCCRPLTVSDCKTNERRQARKLVKKGFLLEIDGAFSLNGSLWREFVKDQHV